MRLHGYEVIHNWASQFPRDDLLLVGPAWVRRDTNSLRHITYITWPNETFFSRVFGEMIVVPAVSWVFRRAPVLSLSPVLSPLLSRSRAYSVSHDWRHIGAPEQFSRAQRIYRRIWRTSLKRARIVFAISGKTASEVRQLEPTANTVVVPNGRDHARRWKVEIDRADVTNRRRIVTFGHKNHKRPELAIEALAHLKDDAEPLDLVILGASGEYRDRLANLAQTVGVVDQCEFPGFVADHAYELAISGSDVVLLLSTDEGFGLPVVEAEYFGIPVIVASDSGLGELHPDVTISQPSAIAVSEAIRSTLRAQKRISRNYWTWADAVQQIRGCIVRDQELRIP
jgi:glycosyltransferase involved in cell wall biosynthesis